MERRNGNREIIPSIKDHSGTSITGTTEKANNLNSYNVCVFCCDRNIPEIILANPGEAFIINIKVIRKILTKIGRNKSVVADGVPGETLKLDGVAMSPYLARLLEI